MTSDPFLSLRQPVVPLAPRPAFADDLKARLRAALTDTDADADERTPAMSNATITETTVVPYLSVRDGVAALAWYTDVFGAIETLRYVDDASGRIGHAELTIGGGRFNLADEYPEMDIVGPATLGGTSVALMLDVVDVDHTYGRAIERGATSPRPPADQAHGHRTATIIDPFGHRWLLSQEIGEPQATAVSPTEEKLVDPSGGGSSWTITHRRPVEPGYLTLHVGDASRASAFFGSLFAWEVEPGNSGEGFGHIHNTTFPMGFAPAGDGPPVTVYFRVDDIEPYAARVIELGGQVLSRTQHDSGGNAECVDDQGFRFDLFQPAPGY